MVAFRNATRGQAVTNWWDNGNDAIAFGRGSKGYVAINHESSSLTRTYQTSPARRHLLQRPEQHHGERELQRTVHRHPRLEHGPGALRRQVELLNRRLTERETSCRRFHASCCNCQPNP